jgi:lipoate-protein ligase A
MKTIKGLEIAAKETNRCNKSGTRGCVEIAYDFDRDEMIATYRAERNNFSAWDRESVKNLFTTDKPMTAAEIKSIALEQIAEIERISEAEAEEMEEYRRQCETEEML